MQKKIMKFLLVISIIALVVAGCTSQEKSTTPQSDQNTPLNAVAISSDINQYKIDAVLNPSDKTLTAKQSVVYVNKQNKELSELYFHVYPNAFKSENTAPFLFDDFTRAYSNGFQPGYLEMNTIEQTNGNNNRKLSFEFSGEDNTILKINLSQPLKQNEKLQLNMDYKVVIPPANERFGWGKNNLNLGNWYPIAAVYDENGWNLDKYYPIGDPFYSEVADYLVNISAPKDYVIASSGKLVKEETKDNIKNWHFEAYRMRDFAFVANNQFLVSEKNVSGTVVKSYYYKEDSVKGKIALEKGAKSIEIFNKMFGKYPYSNYSVVETIFPSGMEYPGIVYISDEAYKSIASEDYLATVVVHETAHQWWYGLVGDDQIDEAWLDESFATYSEKVFNEIYWGKSSADRVFDQTVEKRGEEAIMEKVIDGVVVKSLKDFKDWSDYGPTVYTRGAQALDALRKKVGDDTFFKIIQTYYAEYQYKIAKTTDFIEVSNKVSGQNLNSFFNTWLYAK